MFKVDEGIKKEAIKTVIYGPEGIGKSTLASQFPDPLFIDTEGSTKQLDVKRLKRPSSFNEMIQMIDWVKKERNCATLIIDTADWAQGLVEEAVKQENNIDSIESLGYGKGYVYAREKMGHLLDKLTDVQEVGINVVLTAHAEIRTFEDPAEMGAYDRYELKLTKRGNANVAALVKEWSDMLLFLAYDVISVKADEDGKTFKGQGGKRVIHTDHKPAWDAKNRFGLDPTLPLKYESIAHVIPNLVDNEPIKASEDVEDPFADQAVESEPTKEQEAVMKDLENQVLPKELTDLMQASNITADEIRAVMGVRGHYPINTPFENISQKSPEYFRGGLVANWDGVVQVVESIRENPSN
ncbi:hypothetical protein BWX42_00035 [Dolosigranulum pigrum]|uniref:ATP-binding protein n=1 Tax=Dolosigranulum pigrum TaxID=29394 RepID=A0A1S8KL69_9LACT|nr:hypothetical protein BWX42_00370 [Dolosigranulum pigrum]OOL82158.1 hypothetical protein BWX42_00035 [Dolosigranulum pigrum]